MIAVEHIFYTWQYHGTLSASDFMRFSVKASAYLDRVTFDRINDDLPTATLTRVKLALCEVVDEMARQDAGGELASATNDGVSESYVASGRSQSQRLYAAAALYLSGTGLLYRGC